MKQLVAHSGSPYRFPQLVEVLRRIIFSSNTVNETETRLAEIADRRYCLLTTSGRYALFLILKTISGFSQGRKVIVPLYTCPSVIDAITRSGLTPVFCDLTRQEFNFNFNQLNQLIDTDTVAIIVVNLCGTICDFDRLRSIASFKKVILIEDACQSFGGNYRGKKSGSFGSFSFVSFGVSKNLAAVTGGALFTDDRNYFQALKRNVNLPPENPWRRWSIIIKWMAYTALLHPRLYYLLRLVCHPSEKSNLECDLNREGRMPALQAKLLSALLDYLPALTDQRRSNYHALFRKLLPLKNIQLFSDSSEGDAAIRFPLLCRDAAQRAYLITRLRKAGIEADPFYRLRKQEYFTAIRKDFPVSSEYADRILTLPTHRYLRPRDVDTVFSVFSSQEDKK